MSKKKIPMTEKAFRAAVEREKDAYLWGKKYRIIPCLVPEIFGDGKALIGLQPVNTRPNYYVVRIDSSWAKNLDGEFREHLEDIYDSIKLEYGEASSYDDLECGGCGKETCCECNYYGWPALDVNSGSDWFELDWEYFVQ